MSRSTFRIIATCMLMLTTASLLSACNTIAGAGKDTSAAGHAVTNTADQTKDKM